MIKVLFFDLGGTLESGGVVLPGVPEALDAFSEFRNRNGGQLTSCLVSDFNMPVPRTPASINSEFQNYLQILEQLGLRRFFEPVDERITLSTHAGVFKPARLVFETALARAGVNSSLSECLFITENLDHVEKARQELGMMALQFGTDFNDWKKAPTLILPLVDPSI